MNWLIGGTLLHAIIRVRKLSPHIHTNMSRLSPVQGAHSLVSPCVQLLGDVVEVLLVGPHKHKARGAKPRQGQPFKPGGNRVGRSVKLWRRPGHLGPSLSYKSLPNLPKDLSSRPEPSSPLL